VSLRTSMLRVLERGTNLLLPTKLDQIQHQVTILVRTWLGGSIDAPVTSGPQYTDGTPLVLPQKYPIRQLTTREVDASGGRYEMGDLIVEGIVPADPANPGFGFTPTQLEPTVTAGQEVLYLVTGPHAGEYALGELRTADGYGDCYEYKLVLVRRNTTPRVT
jgi:hypothetical protein